MGVILNGYRRNEQGFVVWKRFDSDDFPAGWYDSPSKVPGVDPPAPEYRVSREPARAVEALPMGDSTHMKPVKRGPGRPRKNAA